MGRLSKLTHAQVWQIDEWMRRKPGCIKRRMLPAKTIAYRLGVNIQTVYNAFMRRGGYVNVKRRRKPQL